MNILIKWWYTRIFTCKIKYSDFQYIPFQIFAVNCDQCQPADGNTIYDKLMGFDAS